MSQLWISESHCFLSCFSFPLRVYSFLIFINQVKEKTPALVFSRKYSVFTSLTLQRVVRGRRAEGLERKQGVEQQARLSVVPGKGCPLSRLAHLGGIWTNTDPIFRVWLGLGWITYGWRPQPAGLQYIHNKLKFYFSPILRKSGGKKAIASKAALWLDSWEQTPAFRVPQFLVRFFHEAASGTGMAIFLLVLISTVQAGSKRKDTGQRGGTSQVSPLFLKLSS